jgi:lipoprotein-anchoring transpeptidase ErfK/SrfK
MEQNAFIKGTPMDTQNSKAHTLIVQAREAMRRGDKASAWKLAEQAARLAPDVEDVWLILTVSDPDPQYALAYAQKALQVNPSSTRARKAVEWALSQLKQSEALDQTQESAPVKYPELAVSPAKTGPVQTAAPQPKGMPGNRKWVYAGAFLALLMCVVVVFSAYSAVTHPAFASILKSVTGPTQESLWAPVDMAKPSMTPIDPDAVAHQAVDTPTARSAQGSSTPVPTQTPTPPSTEVLTQESTATPQVTETPASMVMEIVEDTPTSEYIAPTSSAPLPDIASSGNGVRWIDVDLTNQRVYAYEGDVVVNEFIVSTGTWLTPTVTGQYKVYVKYRSAKMSGPGYYLPNVPYIMYFYKGYGLHGTYWHNNFGTPMSHGCVNLRTDDAAWLYEWASVGTLVNVHY